MLLNDAVKVLELRVLELKVVVLANFVATGRSDLVVDGSREIDRKDRSM